jgi:hypothetical protein
MRDYRTATNAERSGTLGVEEDNLQPFDWLFLRRHLLVVAFRIHPKRRAAMAGFSDGAMDVRLPGKGLAGHTEREMSPALA